MKVNIISKVKHSVLVKVPYAQFMCEWPYEGASIPVEKEILEQLMVHPGFKYMIDNGINGQARKNQAVADGFTGRCAGRDRPDAG